MAETILAIIIAGILVFCITFVVLTIDDLFFGGVISDLFDKIIDIFKRLFSNVINRIRR